MITWKLLLSFPRVEAHYCRAKSSKEYPEDGLSLTRMYNFFVQQRAAEASGQHQDYENYADNTYREPVSLNAYRDIFNTCFNFEFHKPKTDRCDQCEAYKNNPNKSQDATEVHRLHVERKQSTKEERDRDRNCLDLEQAVLCVDLENVINVTTI